MRKVGFGICPLILHCTGMDWEDPTSPLKGWNPMEALLCSSRNFPTSQKLGNSFGNE